MKRNLYPLRVTIFNRNSSLKATVFILTFFIVGSASSLSIAQAKTHSHPVCNFVAWLVEPFGFCSLMPVANVINSQSGPGKSLSGISTLPPVSSTIPTTSNDVTKNSHLTISGAYVSQAELTSRIHHLITYINLRDELIKTGAISDDVYVASSHNPDDLVTKQYLWDTIDGINRVGSRSRGGGSVREIVNYYSTTTDVIGDIEADTLSLGTTSNLAQLTLTEAVYLDSHTPNITLNQLYNVDGDLYWSGDKLSTSSVVNWSLNGDDVYRVNGNIGIGTTNPSERLSVAGSILLGEATATPAERSILGQSGLGTNINGANLIIAAGKSTGTGVGGEIIFQTTAPGSAGMVPNSLISRMRIDQNGSVVVGTVPPAPAKSFRIARTFTTTGEARQLDVGGSAIITVAGGNSSPFIAEFESGGIIIDSGNSHSRSATLALEEPRLTINNGSVNVASTFYILDAPTEGIENYAIFVDQGDTRLDGALEVRESATIQGTTTISGPGSVLALSGGSSNAISNHSSSLIYQSNGTSGTFPFHNAGNLILQPRSNANRNIALMTGSGAPQPRLVVTWGGDIGIGTTTPTARLTTTGTVRFSSLGSGGGTLITDAEGNLTVSSDERLKDIMGSYEAGLDELLLINPIRFNWNEESGFETKTEFAGFSAQNVQLALPMAVTENSAGVLTLADRSILAAVVNAVKELYSMSMGINSEVNELKEENGKLRARIEALETRQASIVKPEQNVQTELVFEPEAEDESVLKLEPKESENESKLAPKQSDKPEQSEEDEI